MKITAWSPGHASILFRPVERDGELVGSTGAGICLSTGVTTTLDTDGTGRSRYDVVNHTLQNLDIHDYSTHHDLDVPLGSGLGGSGALALSTALAAAAATGKTYAEAAEAAHRAELQCRTGLGDVPAQATGGIVLRREPGPPPRAHLDRIPAAASIGIRVLGERETGDMLDAVETLPELDALLDDPTLSNLLRQGRLFSRRTGLLTDRVRDALEETLDRDADAAPAHLGETLLFTGTGEEEASISHAPAHVTEVREI